MGRKRGLEPRGVRQVAALPGELVGCVAEQHQLLPIEDHRRDRRSPYAS
jgi:hypothetical protein